MWGKRNGKLLVSIQILKSFGIVCLLYRIFLIQQKFYLKLYIFSLMQEDR